MNDNDFVFSVLSFGVWVSLLCAALAVAGWIADKLRDSPLRRKDVHLYKLYRRVPDYDAELLRVVEDARKAQRLGK